MRNILLFFCILFVFSCSPGKNIGTEKTKKDFFESSKEAFKKFYGKELDIKSVKLLTGSDLKIWVNANGWGAKKLPCDLSQLKDIINRGDIDQTPIALGLDNAFPGQNMRVVYVSMPIDKINCDKELEGYFLDNQNSECEKSTACYGSYGGPQCHCHCRLVCDGAMNCELCN